MRVGEFRRTARGRAVYDAAPEDAKRFYSRCVGNANPLDPRQVYDLYRTILKDYVQSSAEKAAEIRKYYGAEDWKNYGILVHALKSTSRMIGASPAGIVTLRGFRKSVSASPVRML